MVDFEFHDFIEGVHLHATRSTRLITILAKPASTHLNLWITYLMSKFVRVFCVHDLMRANEPRFLRDQQARV